MAQYDKKDLEARRLFVIDSDRHYFSYVKCVVCGLSMRDKALAKTSHARMHQRKGEAESHQTFGGLHWLTTPTPEDEARWVEEDRQEREEFEGEMAPFRRQQNAEDALITGVQEFRDMPNAACPDWLRDAVDEYRAATAAYRAQQREQDARFNL